MTGKARLVVLNHNGGAHLGRCFDALAGLDWPAELLELVLVDNASTDGSAEAVVESHPRVRLVRNDLNSGFPANNLGLAGLDGVDYVGLVNNDGFVERGWLRALAGALDAHPEAGAVGAKMVFAPRFVGVRVETTPFVPGRGDGRELGVKVSGLLVAGADRWSEAQLGEAWGPERDARGTYVWTSADSWLHVPVPEGWAGDDLRVQVELSAEAVKEVTLRHGDREVVAKVGPAPSVVEIQVGAGSGGGDDYDIVQNAGSVVFDDGCGADRGFGEPDEGQFDQPAEVFAWCGGSVLMRPSYVRATGAFDERFFLYYEDTDWSWRGRAQGWSHRFEPGAVMRHVHAASSVEGSALFHYQVERNRLAMLAKNAPLRFLARQLALYVLITASYARRDVLGPLSRGRRPRPATTVNRVRAFLGFLAMAPAMLAERRVLRARQVVPDSELASWFVKRGST